jgi:hypothetical protein
MKRFRCLLITVLALTSIATAQTPYQFTVTEMAVGSRHIKTLYLYASGKWSYDFVPIPGPATTYIHCYEQLGICEDADAYSLAGKTSASLTTYDIVRWDAREMIAEDSSAPCLVYMLRVDFAAKKVSLSSELKGTQDKPCENSHASAPAFLVGPQ